MALQCNQFSPPFTQKALVMNEKEQVCVWDEAPCPVLPPDEALVRIEAVALNPINTKMKTDFANPFAIMGADFAGTVVAVGSDVVGVAVGDRVCGAQNEIFKATPEQGAFAQYTVTRRKMWMRIPDSWSIEAASSLPVGICTAGLAMKSLGLPLPNEPVAKPSAVLVYGSSTATATIAMQLLRLLNTNSGLLSKALRVIKKQWCTSIPAPHFPVTPDEISEANRFPVAKKIYTRNNLKYALDCISNVESTTVCFNAIGRTGGRYVALEPFPRHAANRAVVTTDFVIGPCIFGEGCTYPAPYAREPDEKLHAFGVELWEIAQKLVHEGKLHHHPVRILDGGFDGIQEGLKLLSKKCVSGEKIVVRMET
ncbi:alcohol dehydrogenase GroES-like domain-containing protein [Colletotrichum graminicola M1.001]|uniref:Alcohol dehydrogenase GroES-like domain-containing protein n=1 Tax=Colletotrichum graminicola (strain M1.001 / M2 / FGSC 10212) TaxID=645133 RepID=E3R0V5_COLGM|nr:alcohol dehydrogenase GroES-like domain-containing protein [Colletotrichum graminicola M1.001]EFQ36743.1 alcohol dehydrogenase GroES-like domain-containing protein [Colletotrichum graminicola M1.001]